VNGSVDSRSAVAQRGRTLLRLGRPAEALRVLVCGLASAPGDAELLLLAGAACLVSNPVEAERMLRQSLAARPESEYGWRLLSHALNTQDRSGEAEAAAVRAVELDPQEWRPVVWLALLQSETPRRRRFAVETAKRAVELAPDEADTHWVLGHVSSSLPWDRWVARKAFDRALRIDPHHTRALNDLGHLRLDQNRSRVAIQNFLRAAATNPRGGTAVESLEFTFRRTLRNYRAYAYLMLFAAVSSPPPGDLKSTIGLSVLITVPVCGGLIWMRSATEGRLGPLMTGWWERDPKAGRRSVALMAALTLAFVTTWLRMLTPEPFSSLWLLLLAVPGIFARCFWWARERRDADGGYD
jgi:tetratricopeptide (TPR) repeat protein